MEGLGGIYIVEPTTWYFQSLFKINKVLAYTRSKYQEIALIELEGFGRALVIDNLIQSTEKDEYIYHETLVHPAMMLHPNPRKVLILGGGEGATLREVLKHGTVEKTVMVDIDEVVIEFAKKYLEYMHRGSFNDPRAEIVIGDGLEYVRKTSDKEYDVVIMDLTDPYASEIAKPLYSLDSFREIYRILGDDGVVVTQAGNSFFYNRSYRYVYDNMEKIFPYIAEYWVWIPSFTYTCNFIIGSKKHDPYKLSIEEFDKRMKERNIVNKYIDGRKYQALLKMGIILGDLEK